MKLLLLTIVGCLLYAGVSAQRRERTDAKASAQERPASRATAGSQAAYPASAVFAEPQAEPQGPVLKFSETVFDFGRVARKGGDVSHDFAFRNEGDRPLVVLRVITSCSCVKASFPRHPVAPGQSGVIRITYEPHKSEPGAFNKVIQIYSNAAGGRDIVTVQGNSIEEAKKSNRVKTKGD